MNVAMRIVRKLSTGMGALQSASESRLARRVGQIGSHGIFWLWNALFMLVVYLGLLPFVGVPLLQALAAGEVPFPFVLPLAGFLLVPPACTLVAMVKLRKHPGLLMRLFYGVEAPIFALCILRLFILRELTPASTVVIVAGALAIATMAVEIMTGYAAYNKGLARFQMAAHTVVLLVGLYVGSVLLFYTVPLLCALLYSFIRLEWLGAMIDSIRWAWVDQAVSSPADFVGFVMSGVASTLIVLWFSALFGFSATLFVAMPYALVALFTRSWNRIFYAFSRQYSRRQGWLISGSVLAAIAILIGLTAPQPQVQTFTLLENAPESPTARQELLQKSPQIRRGLVNAYLYPYRYLSPWQEANGLEWWYPTLFPMTAEQAGGFQTLHNALLSPFLYQGDLADTEKAAALYADFFDTPIQKAEAEAIQYALESTVHPESVEASLLNISDRVIALVRQDVTVVPHGDWAEITLYERYENTTPTDQEIVYQFSLPESAVFTELWLGEADLAERYRFVVAPRGAAQQVYKQEIERAEWVPAEDPALLEQVGPRQYRLRVFPIPRRQSRSEPGVTHLWMTYQVMQQGGQWPLPQLTEKRNLYWTDKTQRYRRGQQLQDSADYWYEAAIPAADVAKATPHTATLAEGYQVTARPVTAAALPQLSNQRLAVLIDTSRSMGDRVTELSKALQDSQKLAANSVIDWYVTSAAGMPPQRFSSETLPAESELSFYGSLPLTQQLQQFDALRPALPYDAVFMLTDAGNYELETDGAIPDIPGSLWLVHLDNSVPTAYSDALQQFLYKSKGGVATSFAEAASRFITEQQIEGTVMDGYRWEITSDPSPTAMQHEPEFLPLAARQAIRWLSRSQDLTQVSQLDQLHAIAKGTEVVTPYSSMLVLVNDRQREALAEAEGSADRFGRELETGEDTLTTPTNPLNVPAVPETESLVGMGFAGGGLLWMLRRRRRVEVPSGERY